MSAHKIKVAEADSGSVSACTYMLGLIYKCVHWAVKLLLCWKNQIKVPSNYYILWICLYYYTINYNNNNNNNNNNDNNSITFL